MAANNALATELTTLGNAVTSHFQNQLQRLPELNDLKDSHAALLTATSEIVNEIINLQNDISYFSLPEPITELTFYTGVDNCQQQ